MGLEMIIGLAVAVLAAIAGAFGLGKSRGTNTLRQKRTSNALKNVQQLLKQLQNAG